MLVNSFRGRLAENFADRRSRQRHSETDATTQTIQVSSKKKKKQNVPKYLVIVALSVQLG